MYKKIKILSIIEDSLEKYLADNKVVKENLALTKQNKNLNL
jgi:hypothetical protein